MAERLRWWVIPGSLVVLARVVTLPGNESVAAPEATRPVAAAVAFPDRAVVQDASGTRSRALDFAATSAFVICLPVAWAGQRADMQVWRRIEGVRELTPWLTLQPRVRDDGTLPMTGLLAGRYDFEVRLGSESFQGSDVVAPGTWQPAAAAAPAR